MKGALGRSRSQAFFALSAPNPGNLARALRTRDDSQFLAIFDDRGAAQNVRFGHDGDLPCHFQAQRCTCVSARSRYASSEPILR